ncbi:rod shape-determining protein MreC [Pelagibacteraceae bacterium]|nr:rod shape-determining protein MreC [Pelagibacteraceae bacterium]
MVTNRDDFIIAIRSVFLKKSNQQRFSLLSLIIFSIIFLILGNFNFKIINYNKTIIKEIIYISSLIVTVPENIIKESFNKISGHFDHYEDYQIAKKELQSLRNKDLSKKIITYENTELKKLIEDYFVEDSQVYAKVLIDKESPFLRSIIINKGSKNNINVGMIVYEDIYLIGKVVEVNYLTSRVLLISDINSKVPVTIQPLNVQAIMSGLDIQKGKLEYIKSEKLINKDNQKLIVVTSGSAGIFKSGIPIGKIDSTNILDSKEIVVNFYRDFSQLKYVKILSYKNVSKITEIKNQYDKTNNQNNNNKILQQKNIINEQIINKFEKENTKLKEKLINLTKQMKIQKNEIKDNQSKIKNIKFLELNLLYGPKCRKNLFRPNLYKINTDEYRNCIFNKGIIKNN